MRRRRAAAAGVARPWVEAQEVIATGWGGWVRGGFLWHSSCVIRSPLKMSVSSRLARTQATRPCSLPATPLRHLWEMEEEEEVICRRHVDMCRTGL
jgi:hypothetical protein